jgi:hypothetical protein
MTYLYRYRPIKAVLDGFRELENQEIYFSTTEELNDPMEGFKDLFWLGDAIVWRNLLRHYILCLLQTFGYCFLAHENFDRNALRNIVFWVPLELPDAPIREIYQRVADQFLSEPAIKSFLSSVNSRNTPIRRHELTHHLRTLHTFGLQIVFDDYRKRRLLQFVNGLSMPPSKRSLRRNAIKGFEATTRMIVGKPPEQIEALFSVLESTIAETTLIGEYNLRDRETKMPMAFLTSRFPEAYVRALERLVHQDWYVACIAKSAENHSMWSGYADGHRGVCLVFNTPLNVAGNPTLAIEQITSASGAKGRPTEYHASKVVHELKPVSYTAKYPAIDFFRSLGSIPEQHLNNFWYLGDNGKFSECRESIYGDIDAWRETYWRTFAESALYKTPEWAHEEEYRIVMHSAFDMSEQDKRKLKYCFKDLVGIVFGARTETEDKLRIMRIVDAKCKLAKRGDFSFYEIRYLQDKSRFQMFPLKLIKISNDRN